MMADVEKGLGNSPTVEQWRGLLDRVTAALTPGPPVSALGQQTCAVRLGKKKATKVDAGGIRGVWVYAAYCSISVV
jgi:hypothetical protein